MANICENKMSVYSTDRENLNYILKYFEDWNSAYIAVIEDNYLLIYFDSKWDFPSAEMKKMTEDIPNKEDITIYVLSIEEGNYYAEYNVFTDGVWETK